MPLINLRSSFLVFVLTGLGCSTGCVAGRATDFVSRDLGLVWTSSDLMRSFISSIFVGFKPTTAEEHLGSLDRYLKLVGLKYTERL